MYAGKEHLLLCNVNMNNLKLKLVIAIMMRKKLLPLRNVKMKIWFKTVKNNNLKCFMVIKMMSSGMNVITWKDALLTERKQISNLL